MICYSWAASSQKLILFYCLFLFPAAVDKEREPLQQEEEEIISQADIEQFNGALPVGTVMGWSVFNHLFYLLLPTSKKEKKDEARAKERHNCA